MRTMMTMAAAIAMATSGAALAQTSPQTKTVDHGTHAKKGTSAVNDVMTPAPATTPDTTASDMTPADTTTPTDATPADSTPADATAAPPAGDGSMATDPATAPDPAPQPTAPNPTTPK